MPEFRYAGIDPQGQPRRGQLSAVDAADALRRLLAERIVVHQLDTADGATTAVGLAPSIREEPGVPSAVPGGGAAAWSFRWRSRQRPRRQDVQAYTAELLTMLRAGLSLDRALRLLGQLALHPQLHTINAQLLDDIKAGIPFSRALAKHPTVFDDFYINMVRTGELSGQLADALARVADHLERIRQLREKALAAATYPAILAMVAVLSLLIMLLYVVPQFRQVFGELGDRLPLATQAIMALSQLLTDHALAIAVTVALSVGAIAAWLRSPDGRQRWLRLQYRLPLWGPLRMQYEQAMFARTLGTLLQSGVALVTALAIAEGAFAHPAYRQALARATADVKQGRRMAEALQALGLFDTLTVNLVRVGEETGRLAPMWQEVAHILERDVQTRMQRLLTVLEPALILILGAIIAGIIVSILLGILSVNDLAL
jgi:general secretion pathway protein F